MKSAILLSVALALSACATVPTAPGPTAPVAAIPSTALSLGDWRRANAAQMAQAFEHEIAARYAAGLPLTAVSSDLRRNDFTCTSNTDSGRGDPPNQICRKTVSVEGCTHTWQVHMFDASGDGALARSRALYDRRCGGDGLLGGPG